MILGSGSLCHINSQPSPVATPLSDPHIHYKEAGSPTTPRPDRVGTLCRIFAQCTLFLPGLGEFQEKKKCAFIVCVCQNSVLAVPACAGINIWLL